MQLTGRAESSVRPAVPADAADIARVQGIAWRTAYRSLLPPSVLDDWDDAAVADGWASSLATPPTPAHGVLVALEGPTAVGFLAHGPAEVTAQDPASPDGPTAEVTALLVEPRWGRRGHGSRLVAAAVDLLGATGVRRLQMWVPREDPVTSGFLESAGWAPDGWSRTLDAGTTTIHEHRWHVLLGDDEGPG
ncbi:GNAT family N-acetyltransferase [Klenkia taihuensis]|uniref:Ribosomal protein S18 acetylase RimI n=1 Tax=Klenkia taihuensis TaxID=1225127 RepID=A0A1I1VAH0_9ACTN|nr:GNAT family N-acetyltransferase [Klenkia taihuensis]GHE14412.1 N-acetyltransferase [Klenkia taihuensis]SFD79966.1 Ribosomal protein S18 acetylase RimI [Klenkia taihuensis]